MFVRNPRSLVFGFESEYLREVRASSIKKLFKSKEWALSLRILYPICLETFGTNFPQIMALVSYGMKVDLNLQPEFYIRVTDVGAVLSM